MQDNDINRTILAKRLSLDGHIVVNTTNGQEGVEMIETDRDFDCILMDIQYGSLSQAAGPYLTPFSSFSECLS